MEEKPSYDVQIADTGFKVRKTIRGADHRDTRYEDHCFTNWGDAARWFAMEMLHAPGGPELTVAMPLTEDDKFKAAMRDLSPAAGSPYP